MKQRHTVWSAELPQLFLSTALLRSFCLALELWSMLKLHFAVAEDEATFLTVFTRGLATEVEIPAGKD